MKILMMSIELFPQSSKVTGCRLEEVNVAWRWEVEGWVNFGGEGKGRGVGGDDKGDFRKHVTVLVCGMTVPKS